jgi:retinol dehydrogenase-12
MKDIQANGKVALVTGANSGIGQVTAKTLALSGYHVFLACRSEARALPVLDEIAAHSGGQARAEFLPLDLGDLASVRHCAELFLARGLPLHLLVANAGLAGQKGLSASGFEMTFGVCHVGHFLLTQLLLERIKAAAPARIVVVASRAHRYARGVDFDVVQRSTRGLTGFKAYTIAKLANVLFAKELGRRLEGTGVTSYALHPGVVATEVWRQVPGPLGKLMKRNMLTEEQGAATSLYCATDPSVASQSGLYYDDCRTVDCSRVAKDQALATRLWDLSEQWVAAA